MRTFLAALVLIAFCGNASASSFSTPKLPLTFEKAWARLRPGPLFPHYGRVLYRAVYPGVDLVFYGSGNELEYDFVLAPDAAPESIELAFSGVHQMQITPDGALALRTSTGVLLQKPPVAYQEIAGQRRSVGVSYQMRAGGRLGFRLGAYDSRHSLVIDPILIYSTFIGGDRNDAITAVAVDKNGNTYIAGETTSGNFPQVNAGLSKPDASVNAFVAKIAPAGSRPVVRGQPIQTRG